MLGLKWAKLAFDAKGVAPNFDAEVVQPIRALASKTIDEGSIIGGIFLPGSIADKVTEAYRKHLFGNATLQDLPNDPPRFVINATNVQTGALFRFSKPYLADYRVGRVMNPTTELAVAVAACAHGPDYGLLWWLNTTGKQWPESPTTSFEARGQGGNIIHVDPAHDLLVVWRWSAQSAEGFKRIVESITNQ